MAEDINNLSYVDGEEHITVTDQNKQCYIYKLINVDQFDIINQTIFVLDQMSVIADGTIDEYQGGHNQDCVVSLLYCFKF